ncbi:hypothetical protein QR680_017785 [Steinernema hermaphroditum]|uniref:non-specific serine/threonine protein kinase n=1 Tax=Steinernema hermaphroditum TaxID=289476 RepID=A0AA39HFT7_9BILA|nr:hypothetical protein QR680_017785 [Steinernema hermaphroditum]
MGTSVTALKLAIGDKIKDQFVVKKKLGEGSCGTVYLVQTIKEPKIRAAMKVEPFMKCKDDEILKMEVYVLKKMQKSKHVCRLLMAGKMTNFSFLVMSLLGKELSDIRRRLPDRKMSMASVLKIGIQSCQAIQDMHIAGFVHRDVKPTNFCVGAQHKNMIYIFDFGLARQIFIPENGKMNLREARSKVSFRGTVRYCSLNVHEYKEQGRHDDLWSMLYMLIELLTGTLPWKGLARRESGQIKAKVADATLTAKCPVSFAELNTMLKKLTYFDTPNYDVIKESFKRDLKETKVKLSDPFEWDVMKEDRKGSAEKVTADRDEKVEIDKMEDTDTHRNIDESGESADSDEESQTKGFAKEDTLENVADMNK